MQLKHRYDLSTNLIETVKGYTSPERETLEGVIVARQQALAAPDVQQHPQAENMLTCMLRRLGCRDGLRGADRRGAAGAAIRIPRVLGNRFRAAREHAARPDGHAGRRPAHPLDVTATVNDLAVLGYLTIEEIQKEG